ncbi:MAG: Uma2 family endonuclease [Symploca sp. SIO2E6]|nr:Uma2 family endonuclease [Symploca sp. SIO2E6]
MIQAISQKLTFDEFIDWYPENSEHRYELHNGIIVKMPKPTGKNSEIAGFIGGELFLLIRQRQLPYFIPKECLIKPYANESGYEPDLIVLDRLAMAIALKQINLESRLGGAFLRFLAIILGSHEQAKPNITGSFGFRRKLHPTYKSRDSASAAAKQIAL